MKTILAEVGGFTPIIDALFEDPEIGLIGAAIFGRIWRYCQGPRGVCYASAARIAEELQLGEKTIRRHLRILVDRGYLEDLTPDRRNRPHEIRDTGKIMLRLQLGIAPGHTDQPDTPEVGHSDQPVGQSDRPRSVTATNEDTIDIPTKTQKEGPSDPPRSDAQIKAELALRLTPAIYEARIRPLTFIRDNEHLRILGPPALLVWAEKVLARQFAEVAQVTEIQFEEQTPAPAPAAGAQVRPAGGPKTAPHTAPP